MNKEDFVTYEQAVALKKLGFNYDCDYCYSEDKELYKYDYHTEYYTRISNDISAPTLAQAQKWLRKTKKHHVDSSCIDKDTWHYTITELIDNVIVVRNELEFSSYEEALSVGITECIKLLENA